MNKIKLSPLTVKYSPMTKRIRMMNLAHSVDYLKLPIKHKKKNTLKPIELIPKDYNDRIDFLKKLFEKEELMPICTNAPLRISSKSEDVGAYMASKLTILPEILAALIIYMSINFTVDTNNLNSKHIPDQSPEAIFKSGSGLSEGLSKLYQSMASGANIRMQIITGQLKPFGYKIGEQRLKHHWCVVKILTSYYLIDPTMAIGYIDNSYEFIPYIRPYYFLTPPHFLIDSHKPDLDKYQFLERPIQTKLFADTPMLHLAEFYCNIFKYNITIHNTTFNSNQIAIVDSLFVLKVSIPDYIIIEVKLIKYHNDSPSISTTNDKDDDDEDDDDDDSNNTECKEYVVYANNAKIDIDERSQIYNITITFPLNGDYTIVINGKKTNAEENEEIAEMIKLKFNVAKKKKRKEFASPNRLMKNSKLLNKSSSEMDMKLKHKCYDNKGAYLYEPKYLNLRIGHETKFKVRIKDAILVVVLDGRKWNYLKTKEDSIYEGIVTIQSENVVICCLKNSNVFTEVFEFYAFK